MKKRILALLLAVVMIMTTAYYMPKNVRAEDMSEDNIPEVLAVDASTGKVSPYAITVNGVTCYNVGDILGGTGAYWSVNHKLLEIATPEGITPNVYCAEPLEATPNTSVDYEEVFETDISTEEGKKTIKYQGIMPYACSGYAGSSNNPEFYGWARNGDYGGTFGTYVIDGVARQGMMVNGVFYEMNQAEAVAVCAAAVHAVSGSEITSIYSKVDGNHNAAISDCFSHLVRMGNYAYNQSVNNGSFWYGLDAVNNAVTSALSMSYVYWVQNPSGIGGANEWIDLSTISASQTGDFDWKPYVNASGNIVINARLETTGMETKLIKSSVQSGTAGNISYTHSAVTGCNFDGSKAGYYDYFQITEGANNTVSNIQVNYGGLSSLEYSLIDPTTGNYIVGTKFYQDAHITIPYSELNTGAKLDLAITSGTGMYAGLTIGEPLTPVGKVFRAAGYQDVVLTNSNNSYSRSSTLYASQKLSGTIEINKKSANPEVTDSNSCYSLEGAVYCVYRTYTDAQNDTNRVASITTDKTGYGKVDDIDVGTYYVKEVTPPPGYALDLNIYPATVNSSVPVLISLTDYPRMDPVSILLRKQGSDGKYLPDAEFTVKFYEGLQMTTDPAKSGYTATKTWVLKTDEDGYASLSKSVISGDELYPPLSNGHIGLPAGTVTIQETKEPEGYKIDDTVHVQIIKVSGGTGEVVDSYNAPIISNDVKKQAFQIIKYGETDDAEKNPLANAGFMACNVEDLSKDTNGNYIFDETKAVVITTDGKKELFTDENGYALSCELSYGTYMVRETTVPENYFAIDDFFVVISEDSDTPQNIRYFTDEVFKAYLKIIKKDSDTKESILNNEATFKIWSYEDNKYVTWNVDGSSGQVIDTVSTDETGVLITPNYLLPGKYRIEEVVSPENYINGNTVVEIEIAADAEYDVYTDEDGNVTNMGIFTVEIENTPIKGYVEVNKLGESRYWDEDAHEFKTSVNPLGDIEFGIYAAQDILSSDGQNTVIYEKNTLIETIVTDDKGYAISSSILLPGKYIIRELNTPEGYIQMEDVEITLSADDIILNDAGSQILFETIDVTNKPYVPEIHTTAKDDDTGTNVGSVSEECKIIDTVTYENLIPGKEYVVKGILMDKSTGEPLLDNGKEITAERTFTPKTASGNVDMIFTFNSSAMAGKTTVVFENLYYDEVLVATHTEISDEKQTVYFPKIHTTAKDDSTGSNVGSVSEECKIIDTVTYENLIPGKEYVLKGILMDKSTGEPLLDNGKEITAERTFTPKTASGNVDMIFTFNSSAMAGKTTVVFENLYYDEVLVATHTEISDEKQTVYFPKIHTTAKDDSTGSNVGSVSEECKIIDTVTYENLIPGKEYVLKGILMDKSTGEPLLDNGKEITAEKTFIPDKPSGSVDVIFVFNSKSLYDRTVVVFETLYYDDTEVTAHTDIEDAYQTILFPPAPPTPPVETGDSTPVILFAVLMLISLISILTLKFKKK